MDDFERLRERLFGVAYRMLGSAADAEEIVQDAWLRWQGVDRSTVRDPAAYLAKVVTNLSMKQLTSARVRRETYVGEWLPEPVLTGRAEFDAPGPLRDRPAFRDEPGQTRVRRGPAVTNRRATGSELVTERTTR